MTPGKGRFARLCQPSPTPYPFPNGLIPPESCEKVLSASIALTAAVIGVSDFILLMHNAVRLLTNVPFEINLLCLLITATLAVFRGISAPIRYAVFNVIRLFATTGVLMLNGLTPSWPLFILVFLLQTGLLYGARRTLAAFGLVAAIFAGMAIFWIRGPESNSLADPVIVARALDYRSTELWIRQFVFMFGLIGVVLFMGWLVLLELDKARQQRIDAGNRLAAEQAERAKAEAARLRAELAAGEALKFDALGRMASGVAHDINNALCVIKCWSTMVDVEGLDSAIQEAFQEIRSATESSEQLMQQLLAFSRNDPNVREVVDLSAVVEAQVKTLSRLLPRDIVISVDVQGPTWVRFGRGQLQRILLNLAINARDAMPQGGSLSLRVGTDPSKALPVVLEFTDTGVGMDEATQDRIFEPFFTTKASGRGTGLGLATVFGLVVGAGGNIAVVSQPGKGTTFILSLPTADPSEARPLVEIPQTAQSRSCTTLVADDHPEIRRLIERILKADGFSVETAADGDGAVAALERSSGKFDLLIVDGVMSGRPTRDVIAKALEYNPSCKVILCSAHFRDELLLRGIDAGNYARLDKPFSSDELKATVARVLG